MRDKEKSKPLEEKACGRPTKYKNHASAHCKKKKNDFFMLLHAAERPKRSFSYFCTLQKDQKEVFYASARYRKAKKKFFMLLHTAERPKRSFSRCCTLQRGQKEVFHASAHCRKAKKKYYSTESIKIQLSLTLNHKS